MPDSSAPSDTAAAQLVDATMALAVDADDAALTTTTTTTPPSTATNVAQNFKVGIAEDMNRRCRRTIEDAHSYNYDFASVQGQGFFGVFDGHAGKQAAEWCGNNLHDAFRANLELLSGRGKSVAEILHTTFTNTDSELNDKKGIHSGCTAVVAFVRTEDCSDTTSDESSAARRMLYCANVGDARAVLCRDGHAVRLSYDHKGSDPQEIKRIIDSGGFIMNNRVNGVLAVTRSLGDTSMKELIVSHPYTTQVQLCPTDSFLILACDGVWDVMSDQQAVDHVLQVEDPQEAADMLVKHALSLSSLDNISCMVIRFCDH